jgi:hypothetical protein
MKRFILSVGISILVVLPRAVLEAEEVNECSVKIGVIDMGQSSPQKGWKLWPPSAEEWWTKDGKRKFRGFCWAMTLEEADWLILWSSNIARYTEPPVIIGLGSGTFGGRGEYEAHIVTVRARLYRGTHKPIEEFSEQSLPEPSLISRKESTSSRKPAGKQAFEELFKYIAKQKRS